MKLLLVGRIGKSLLATGLLLGLTTSMVFAQGVPAAAKTSFQNSAGGAAAAWNAGPNGTWEAAFSKEGQRMVYCYDQAGTLQQKKIVGSLTALPATVQSSVKAAYPTGEVQYAYKVVDRTNQKYYEVQVMNGAGVDRMRYSLEGKPIGKTSMAGVQPAGASPAASTVATAKPATSQPIASASKPANTNPPVAMRGETANTKPAPVLKEEDLDEDLGDLMDDEDMEDLMEEDEKWDEVDLLGEEEDDIDLLDGTEDLDVEDDLDLEEDDDDGI